mmetsp:Transcript_27525/g.80959  ORF Transcript_27525/g.80959 Transcript_27525/m.80959 type:complete len:314 (-) Transcript_27525:430-1371(-)
MASAEDAEMTREGEHTSKRSGGIVGGARRLSRGESCVAEVNDDASLSSCSSLIAAPPPSPPAVPETLGDATAALSAPPPPPPPPSPPAEYPPPPLRTSTITVPPAARIAAAAMVTPIMERHLCLLAKSFPDERRRRPRPRLLRRGSNDLPGSRSGGISPPSGGGGAGRTRLAEEDNDAAGVDLVDTIDAPGLSLPLPPPPLASSLERRRPALMRVPSTASTRFLPDAVTTPAFSYSSLSSRHAASSIDLPSTSSIDLEVCGDRHDPTASSSASTTDHARLESRRLPLLRLAPGVPEAFRPVCLSSAAAALGSI